MSTIFDWITVGIFFALVLLFLQRREGGASEVMRYGVAGIGCAVANQVGNAGFDIAAWLMIAAISVYSVRFIVMKPA